MQGDVAQREVLQEMFGLLRDHFDNRCTAFVHNAGLLAGFSSMSEYEGAPTLERTSNQQLLNPLDAELSRCSSPHTSHHISVVFLDFVVLTFVLLLPALHSVILLRRNSQHEKHAQHLDNTRLQESDPSNDVTG